MNGRIYFKRIDDLADFLRYFCPSSATFEVRKCGEEWVLEFLGGN